MCYEYVFIRREYSEFRDFFFFLVNKQSDPKKFIRKTEKIYGLTEDIPETINRPTNGDRT